MAQGATAGPAGDNGWTAQFATEVDGERRIQRLTGWLNDDTSLAVPSALTALVGQYVGPTGYTATKANATDIRGATGAIGTNGWTIVPEINTRSSDNAKVFRVKDLTGGTGTKPPNIIGRYVGPDGLVVSIANAEPISDEITTDTVDPTASDGANGDRWINTDTGSFFFKNAGAWLQISGGGADDPNLHAAWDGTGVQITNPTYATVFGAPYSTPAATKVFVNGTDTALTTAFPSWLTSESDGRVQMSGATGSQNFQLVWTPETPIDYKAISATFRVNRTSLHQNSSFFFGTDGRLTNWDAFTSGSTKGLVISTSLSAGRVLIQRADTKQYLNNTNAWQTGFTSSGDANDPATYTAVNGDNFFKVVYFEGRVIIEHNGTRIFDGFLPTGLPDISGGSHGGWLEVATGFGGSTATRLKFNANNHK